MLKQTKLYNLNKGASFFFHSHWYTVDHHDGQCTHAYTKGMKVKYFSTFQLVLVKERVYS